MRCRHLGASPHVGGIDALKSWRKLAKATGSRSTPMALRLRIASLGGSNRRAASLATEEFPACRNEEV